MVSIQSVYRTVKNLVNKDQKGFISPEVFNSFAKIAQLNIYNEIYEDIILGKKVRRQNVDGDTQTSAVTRSKVDLSVFSTRTLLKKDTNTGAFFKPYDFSVIISCNLTGPRGNAKTPISLLHEEEKIQQLLSSNLSAPTTTAPVALVSDDIEVFPTSVSRIELVYYRVPKTPSYQVSTLAVGGQTIESFDETISQDFELPSHYEQELVAEIVKMVGINLKDQNVATYGATEEQQA